MLQSARGLAASRGSEGLVEGHEGLVRGHEGLVGGHECASVRGASTHVTSASCRARADDEESEDDTLCDEESEDDTL